jgi:hypothetical protein
MSKSHRNRYDLKWNKLIEKEVKRNEYFIKYVY